jgi:hypothetical protein
MTLSRSLGCLLALLLFAAFAVALAMVLALGVLEAIGAPPGVVALDAEGFRPTQKEKAGAAMHPQLTGPKGTVRPVGYSFHPPQRRRGGVALLMEGALHDDVESGGERFEAAPIGND